MDDNWHVLVCVCIAVRGTPVTTDRQSNDNQTNHTDNNWMSLWVTHPTVHVSRSDSQKVPTPFHFYNIYFYLIHRKQLDLQDKPVHNICTSAKSVLDFELFTSRWERIHFCKWVVFFLDMNFALRCDTSFFEAKCYGSLCFFAVSKLQVEEMSSC